MTVRIPQLALLILGGVLLLFAAVNWLLPRARYSSSSPQPNAVLTTMPEAVTIEFTNELHRASIVAVASTVTLSSQGDKVYGDRKRFSAHASNDNHSRTVTVPLDRNLPNGLYWVNWSTVAARGKAGSFGDFCFTVGMPIPEDVTRDRPAVVVEHDSRYRDQRAVLVGGFLLVGIGMLLPLFSGERSTRSGHLRSFHSTLKRD